MTAARHINDALTELVSLDRDLDTMLGALQAGKAVTREDLTHLRQIARGAHCQAAMAQHALTHVAPADRRDQPRITLTADLPPTLPQLLSTAQKAVDAYHAEKDPQDVYHGALGFESAMPDSVRRLP